MREKEIAEIRRRLQPERHAITHIYGCYVNEEKEILTTFAQSLGLMPQDEAEKYLALFRRGLSGTLHKNLLDISFTTAQVADSDEHRLLSDLRKTELKSDEVRRIFYEKVMETSPVPGNYLILLLHNRYDVPFRGKDGAKSDGDEVFSYIQCILCPVKLTKSALAYRAAESEFHNSEPGWVVTAPELGFLFPAFDERSTNLYGALYYTHDIGDVHENFLDALFSTEVPMPAAAQKDCFGDALHSALEEDCTLPAVSGLHQELSQMIQLHKESKEPDALVVTEQDVGAILQNHGVTEEKAQAFCNKMADEFGKNRELCPKNLIDHKKLEIVTPQVSIKVTPEYAHLIETRILGGVKYLVIRAEEGVEVNGVSIHIPEE